MKKLFVVIFIFLCICGMTGTILSARSLQRAHHTCGSPVCELCGKQDKSDEEESLPSFEEFLKDPRLLGFSPDLKMFKAAYLFLKTRFVKPVDDNLLVKGCCKEVNRLLQEAKVGNVKPFSLSDFNTIEQAINGYASHVKKDLLYYAAIRGMLAGLDDPYTMIMTPREYDTLMEQMQERSFGGIGIFIELDKDNNDTLTVFEPIEGTPAYKAGLHPQDAIMYINSETTKGMKLDVAVAKLRGPVGTKVTLGIKRPGVPDMKKIVITRDNIKVISVACRMISGKYGYIKIRTFGEDTDAELLKALNKLEEKKIRGLILDLRNNGGGYIDAAVRVCSYFLPSGSVVVSVAERDGMKRNYNAEGSPRPVVPLVVLVNKYSASASEITAGAIQDYKSGVLMGTKTFGKGSVQQIFPIKDGGAIKITTAHYYTPKGRDIDKVGIAPDILVEMEPKYVGRKDDVQLKHAVKYFDQKSGN